MSLSLTKLSRKRQRASARLAEFLGLASDEQLITQVAPTISRWSVGEQLHHIGLVDNAILDTFDRFLQGGIEPVFGRPNIQGVGVMLGGWIPRGKGKAPAAVLPQGAESKDLRQLLEACQHRLTALDLEGKAKDFSFPHPVFGVLSLAHWLRFIEIHHNHHGRIIADIRQKTSRTKHQGRT